MVGENRARKTEAPAEMARKEAFSKPWRNDRTANGVTAKGWSETEVVQACRRFANCLPRFLVTSQIACCTYALRKDGSDGDVTSEAALSSAMAASRSILNRSMYNLSDLSLAKYF